MSTAQRVSREILTDSYQTILILFRILIPALILVKILDYFGATEYLSALTQPLMAPMGLPDMAGLIWATTMIVNIYTGVAVFLTLADPAEWTQAQTTCLAMLMLTTHNLVVELRIAQQSGCRLFTQLLLRMFTAVFFCYLCYQLFQNMQWLQQPAEFLWQAPQTDDSLMSWVITQTLSLLKIAVVIVVLIALLRLFKKIGIERLFEILLTPVFQVMGLGREAVTITIVGFTLGLAYGGGLLIKEARSGEINQTDVFSSVSLLGICHSLIEDTFLVLIIGANLNTVLVLRLVLSIIVISILIRLVRRMSEKTRRRFLYQQINTAGN